jgi:hypothetical protein
MRKRSNKHKVLHMSPWRSDNVTNHLSKQHMTKMDDKSRLPNGSAKPNNLGKICPKPLVSLAWSCNKDKNHFEAYVQLSGWCWKYPAIHRELLFDCDVEGCDNDIASTKNFNEKHVFWGTVINYTLQVSISVWNWFRLRRLCQVGVWLDKPVLSVCNRDRMGPPAITMLQSTVESFVRSLCSI